MGLNCQKGDLARIVGSIAGNNDKIVRCLEYVGAIWFNGVNGLYRSPAWRVDRLLNGCHGNAGYLIEDRQLRPIRDNPGEDEMLRIAGKPNETPADVIEAARGVPVE